MTTISNYCHNQIKTGMCLSVDTIIHKRNCINMSCSLRSVHCINRFHTALKNILVPGLTTTSNQLLAIKLVDISRSMPPCNN